MHSFTIIFLCFLALAFLIENWLAWRHIRFVRTHRKQVPADFADRISLAAHQKAADYTITKTRFGTVTNIIGVALLLIWTLGGGLEALDKLWRSSTLGPLTTGAGFMLSTFLIMGLLSLPASIYQTFVIEERFGFNKTTTGTFIGDILKQTGLMFAIGTPLIYAALWLMQQAGSLWWLYLWFVWTGFSLFMAWAYPVWIAPLFNKFKPLEREALEQRIQNLLTRTGFKSKGIFVMDGSRRSAHGNAYFSGFGKSKRIVFFDTLLGSLNDGEIEAVLAHELGHFKRRHIIKRMGLIFLSSLAGLAALGWLAQQPWFYQGLGISQASNHAALMLFMLVGPVFTFLLHPLITWGSRKHEFEADAFAAEQSDAQQLISALVKLYEENANTLTPDPVHSIFYDSHPPAPVRINRLLAYI